MDTVQLAAATIIQQVLGGRNLTQVLSDALGASAAWTPQQRGALQDICYGTLRFYGQLSAVLDALLSKPLKDERIRCLLLAALYQLNYSKAASHAVVDFAVKSSRKMNPAVSGLVNAVLRNFLRNQTALLQQAGKTETGLHSYPQWWIKQISKQYGTVAPAILQAGNLHPPLTLRVNSRKATAHEYLQELQQAGMEAQIIAPDAIMLRQAVAVEKIPGFREGRVTVQDAGAQYAALLLDAHNGMRVLDACAAPGGKSTHILELADVELHALDKDPQRLKRVQENIERLQAQAKIIAADASDPAAWWDGKPYQRILADVPCSATGVVKRHPDIKWLRRAEDIPGFAEQQLQILLALWPLLAEGGKLLYATCSIFREENQEVVDAFLQQQADAVRLPLQVPDMIQGQLLPTEQHDGFFYALLSKSSR